MTTLVTGASGLLGANLCLVAADRGHQVAAVSNQTPVHVSPGVSVQLDLCEGEAVEEQISRLRPDLIVHCAALTDVDACETDRARAFAVNAEATRGLAHAAVRVGARMVTVSTDAVFDGEVGGYVEGDQTAPVNVYAESKLAGERGTLDASPDHLVVRTTLFGWNAQPKRSLAEWVLARLESGDRVPGFTDAVFAPLEASTLGGLLLDLAEGGATGVWHLGSCDGVTKYDFARTVATVFGFDPDRVDEARMHDVDFRAMRPPRTALDSRRAAAHLGRDLPTVADGIRRMRALRNSGWVDRLSASVTPSF